MNATVKALLAWGLSAFAPAVFAQTYNMELTGVGNGTVADGVYVSPYQGTISGPGVSYTGYVICDDFNTESYLNQPWVATMTNAGALNGSEKFSLNGAPYTTAEAYNAAAWLANGLLANLNNQAAQVNYSFAIWDIFDGQKTDPDGGAATLEAAAFSAALGGYVGSNVSVFTADPINKSQEFLVVNAAPEIDPTSAASGLTLLLGGLMVLRGRRSAKPVSAAP